MKKFFLAFMLLGLTRKTNAQVLFGVRAGVNFTSSNANYPGLAGLSASERQATRFHSGVFAEIPVIKRFFVQPEILVNQYGGKQGDMNDRLTMLTIASLFKVKFSSFGFYAGPQYDYLLSAQYSIGNNYVNSDLLSKGLFSGSVGAEYYVRENLSLGVRYQKTFSNGYGYRGPGQYYLDHNAISLSAAYIFGRRD